VLVGAALEVRGADVAEADAGLLGGGHVADQLEASITYGYSLYYIWLQPLFHMATASITACWAAGT
jgi:hypothetical protein